MIAVLFGLPADRHDSYSRLLDGLAARGRLTQVRFASLNYECLFEEAVTLAGYRVAYFAADPVRPGGRRHRGGSVY